MAEALAMHGVWKRFEAGGRRFSVLRGVDLVVQDGELALVLGRSGSGKTTLLSLAGLLDRPDEGRVRLAGRDVTGLKDADRYRVRRREVGWVFQAAGLLPLLTAAENVAVALRIQGLQPADCLAAALQALERVGLADRARHRAFELSGGEQQRVALARAAVKAPRLLLADEPTGQLDSETGREVARLVRGLTAAGTTVIMATHDAALTALADRVLTIRDGRLSG